MRTIGSRMRKVLGVALGVGLMLGGGPYVPPALGGVPGSPARPADGLGLVPNPVLALASAQEPPPQRPAAKPPAAQDEFVPIDEIPESDKLPAAPFMMAAYSVAWLAMFGYVWSLWRRLSRVEEELKRVARGPSGP